MYRIMFNRVFLHKYFWTYVCCVINWYFFLEVISLHRFHVFFVLFLLFFCVQVCLLMFILFSPFSSYFSLSLFSVCSFIWPSSFCFFHLSCIFSHIMICSSGESLQIPWRFVPCSVFLIHSSLASFCYLLLALYFLLPHLLSSLVLSYSGIFSGDFFPVSLCLVAGFCPEVLFSVCRVPPCLLFVPFFLFFSRDS